MCTFLLKNDALWDMSSALWDLGHNLLWYQCYVYANFILYTKPYIINHVLTLKHRETHGCVVSTVATDALVLKHQAISILSTD